MKSSRVFFALLALFAFLNTITLIESSFAVKSPGTMVSPVQSSFEKREGAYRANNISVALLEQYKAKDAVESSEVLRSRRR